MKKYLSKVLLVAASFFTPVLASAQSYKGAVNYVSKETDGVYHLRANGAGKSKSKSITDAKENLIKVLLFQGIPGTDISAALVTSGEQAMKDHANYFDDMFKEKSYERFIMASRTVVDYKKKQIELELKINVAALRKDLEQHGITRKFGL